MFLIQLLLVINATLKTIVGTFFFFYNLWYINSYQAIANLLLPFIKHKEPKDCTVF